MLKPGLLTRLLHLRPLILAGGFAPAV